MTTKQMAKKLTRWALALAAAAAMWMPRAASAQQYELSIGSTTRYMGSDSVDALTADSSMGMFSIAAGFHLNQVHLPLFDLLADVSLDTGTFGGTTFQRIQSESRVTTGMVGARLRWTVSPRGSFYGRAMLGASRVSLSLEDMASSAALGDAGWSASTYLGGGVELLPARLVRNGHERFSLGVRLEGGYFASTSVKMRAVSTDDKGANVLRLPTTMASLGSLDPSGWSLRFAVVTRF